MHGKGPQYAVLMIWQCTYRHAECMLRSLISSTSWLISECHRCIFLRRSVGPSRALQAGQAIFFGTGDAATFSKASYSVQSAEHEALASWVPSMGFENQGETL